MKTVRILIIGLGSIGQRHCKNLAALGYKNLYAVSSGKGTMDPSQLPLIAKTTDLYDAFDQWQPEIVFICSPTSKHLYEATYVIEHGCHVFIEKPIGIQLNQAYELRKQLRKDKIVAVGFQFRQHPVLKAIKKLVEDGIIGELAQVKIHWGEYLPDWHPWEDYRKSYSALKSLGGGVTYTLSHPMDYMRWIFGEMKRVSANIVTKGLDIEGDTIHNSIWEGQNGLSVNLHLDYLEKPAKHEMDIIGTKGKIHWKNEDGVALVYVDGALNQTITPPNQFERNDLFLDEVKDFMKAIENQTSPNCTFDDGVKNLEMIEASREADVLNMSIDIEEYLKTFQHD